MANDVDQVVERIEECIAKAWNSLRNERQRAIWWDEQEIILPFYLHLQPTINELNKHLKGLTLYVMPQYGLRASSYAQPSGEKFPLLRKGKTEFARPRKVDLAIIGFDADDFGKKKDITKMTHWYIKHLPLILLEFKLQNKEYLKPRMEEDLRKLKEIQQNYQGVKKVYFCYLADEKLSEQEFKEIADKTKTENLRVCYGTANGKDWGII